MQKYELIIDGKEIETREYFQVQNKFNDEVIANVAIATEKDVEHAVNVAHNRFQNDSLTPYDRYQILQKASVLLGERKEEIARVLVQEVGKTIKEARVEVDRSVQTLLLSAEEGKRISGELVPLSSSPGSENKFGYYKRVPMGVICAITPFNVPLNLSCHKIGPAIASGNTVVWKPSSDTPISAYILYDVLQEAGLPDGYVNVLCGSGSKMGDWFLKNDRIAKYTFTGSPRVGLYIKENSGFRNVSLELGNNSPNIVHFDSDYKKAAQSIVKWGFSLAGQACISAQRIYVHRSIKAEFLSHLTELTNQLVVGDPQDDHTDVGPVISSNERNRIHEWIQEAVEQGAKLITGGKVEGNLVHPTILDDVRENMKIACEEVFGPVLAVVEYDDLDEAIDKANEGHYGLQSGIYTENLKTAMYVADKFKTGGVVINDASTYRADLMPYGGIKGSGIGKEGPAYAIESMTELKMIVMDLA